MYNVELSPFLIKIKFTKLTNLLELIMIFDFYKNNNRTIISKIFLKKNINDLIWYKDITLYKNNSVLFFIFELKGLNTRGGVETTHILEKNIINYDVTLEIHTLNKDNILPELESPEKFKLKVFNE